jgi:hypothetical protein
MDAAAKAENATEKTNDLESDHRNMISDQTAMTSRQNKMLQDLINIIR